MKTQQHGRCTENPQKNQFQVTNKQEYSPTAFLPCSTENLLPMTGNPSH
jgi:hypothetical protein